MVRVHVGLVSGTSPRRFESQRVGRLYRRYFEGGCISSSTYDVRRHCDGSLQRVSVSLRPIVGSFRIRLRTDDHQCALEVTAKSNDGSIEEEVVSVGQF